MDASLAMQRLADGPLGCAGSGSTFAAHEREDGVEAALVGTDRREPVIGGEQVRRPALQLAHRIELIGEHLENQPRVELGVVHMPCLQAPVLIVLHQPVIGVLREGQRVEPERVDGRLRKHGRPAARGCGEVRQIEADDVVPQKELGIPGEPVEADQRLVEPAALEDETLIVVRPDRREREEPARHRIDLEVERQAAADEGRPLAHIDLETVVHLHTRPKAKVGQYSSLRDKMTLCSIENRASKWINSYASSQVGPSS
jgi:hypothetical protein